MQAPIINFQEIDEEAIVTGGIVMAFAFIFASMALLQTYFEHNHIGFIREASVPIVFGLIIGLITFIGYFEAGLVFNPQVFFFALLPIIVFKEGYSLNKQHFLKNHYFILIYGILGTILNFIILLAVNYALTYSGTFWVVPQTQIEKDESLGYQMFFSAAITSKDSAVSLSVLEFEHTPKLHSIIFGEQILNDVIVFALSKTVLRYNNDNDNITYGHWYNFLIFIALVIAQLLVGLVVGLVIGFFSIWITKQVRCISAHPPILTIFIICSAYFAFSLCEAFDFCGVVSVLICGIMMSHYQTYNLPVASVQATKTTILSLAYLSETVIYFYIGFAITDSEINVSPYVKEKYYPFVLLQFFVIQPFTKLISFLISQGIAYLIKPDPHGALRINRYEFFILFYSGLIKGVVAYALICEKPEKNEYYAFINYAALYIIVGTTLFIGGTLKYVSEWAYEQMEIEHLNQSAEISHHHSAVESSNQSELKKTFIKEDVKTYDLVQSNRKWFKNLDEGFIKPLLIYNYAERKQNILLAKKQKKGHGHGHGHGGHMEMYEDSVVSNGHNNNHNHPQKKSKLNDLELESDSDGEGKKSKSSSQLSKKNKNHH